MSEVKAWWKPFYEDLFGGVQLIGGEFTKRRQADAALVATRLALAPGSRVLDIPCGNGRIANELAAQGHSVTGIDFNPVVLENAREEAQSRGLSVTYEQGDMRALDAHEQFDAALCFWGSFGYFSDEDNAAFVASVARSLAPGGRFLIDTPAADSLPSVFRSKYWNWVDEQKRLRLLEENNYDPYTGRGQTQWTLIGPDVFVERESSIRLYTVRELNELFQRCGFARVEAYNGHEDGPYSMLSRRLLLVGWKAG